MKLIHDLPSGWLSPLKLVLSFLFMLGAISNGQSQTVATAQISNTPLGGGVFDYTITLNNTGTTPIETFWFAWVPGQDYLATVPTNIVSPTNWSAIITGPGGGSDGSAIQWKTSLNPLATSSSLTFSFESTDTPAAIAGNSVFFPTTPVGTSFVYSGAPFVGTSDQFVVQSVPEPSTVALLLIGVLGLFWAGWRRNSSTSLLSL